LPLAAAPLADAKNQNVFAARFVFQRIAGLTDQIGDVDFGQRIGAFDHQHGAGGQARQRLAGAQRRQRAFEAAQVDGGFADAIAGGIVHQGCFTNPGTCVKHIRNPALTVPPAPRHISGMIAPPEHRQRIARLTPLDDVRRRIAEGVAPVMPRDMRAAAALGATLARDIAVEAARPATPLALIDGWSVHAELTADAGADAPAILPHAREVAVGKALRGDGDAVVPLETVIWRDGKGEVHMAVAPAAGVLLPGADAAAGEVLRPAGHRLRAIDVAAMLALGIGGTKVRKPRIRVARAGKGRDDIADAITDWLAYAIAADGGDPIVSRPGADLGALLSAGGVDAVAMVGGTGAGAGDDTVHALARIGSVEVHGIAVSPGETAAFGFANARPVLLIPGRLDAAVAVWQLIGRGMLTTLRGGVEDVASCDSALTAKVTSTVGLSELVLVRRVAKGVEPLASKYLPLAKLAQADGWIVIPPASEGVAAGTRVAVRPLP
jgi:molybdopterin molybdotransferase